MAYFLRSGALIGFAELVAEFGVELNALLKPLNLASDIFDDEDNFIDIVTASKLLENAAQQCDCPHFGLLLGSRQSFRFLGVLGLMMQSAPNTGHAFKECFQHHELHVQGVHWSTHIEGGYAFAKLSYEGNLEPSIQSIGLSLAQANNMWRMMTNNDWRPTNVCFHYDAPAHTWFYRQLFGTNITFNADFDGLIFPAQDLLLPVHTQDDYLHDTLNRFVTDLHDEIDRDCTTQVKRAIRQVLPTGRSSLDSIARLFNCDKRTLQRRLKKENTTYQALLNEERMSIACKHLSRATTPLTTIAELVGLSDISTFSRAFKQQIGCSPSEWRERHTQT